MALSNDALTLVSYGISSGAYLALALGIPLSGNAAHVTLRLPPAFERFFGSDITVAVSPSDTVGSLKQLLQVTTGVGAAQQAVAADGAALLDDNQLLTSIPSVFQGNVELTHPLVLPASADYLTVLTPFGLQPTFNPTVAVALNVGDTVMEVQSRLAALTGVPASSIYIGREEGRAGRTQGPET